MLTVANSDLLTVLPQQWLDFPITAPLVQALDVPAFSAAPICIVRRQDMPLTPLAEHLCDHLRRVGIQYAYDRQKAVSAEVS